MMRGRVRVFVGIILLLVALGAGLAVLAVVAAPQTDALRVVIVGQNPFTLAVDTRTGSVFVVNSRQRNRPSTISVLGAADGSPRRTEPVGVWAHGIVVDDRRGRAFVANTADARSHAPNSVSVIDTRTEREQRRVTLGASAMTLAVDRTVGHVFVGLSNGRVRILDTANGRSVGTVVLGFTPLASGVDERRGRAVFVGPGPAGAGGIAGFDTRDGHVFWKTTAGLDPSVVAVDTRQGHVFVGSAGPGPGTCVFQGGYCARGSVSMLDARDGRVLRTVNVGQNPSSIVADEQTQRVLVVSAGTNQSDSGTVSVLDARDGRALGAWRVVAGPVAVAVDERTDRVFVASADVSGGIAQAHQVSSHSMIDQINFFEAEASNEMRLLHKGQTGTVSVFDAQKVP